MPSEFENLVNEAALKIKEVLVMSVREKKFPTYELHVVDEAITDKEEDGMGDVPSDQKFSHNLERRPGVILDVIDIEKVVGAYPGALGASTPQSSYPYVILNPDGSITRRVGSRFPDKEGYFPSEAPFCCRSENSFPLDYLVYAGRALDAIQRLSSTHELVHKMFYVVFVDTHAGGYGYWLGKSEQELRDSLKGEGYEEVRYGSLPLIKEEKIKELLDKATRFAPKPFHEEVNRALIDLEASFQNAPPT